MLFEKYESGEISEDEFSAMKETHVYFLVDKVHPSSEYRVIVDVVAENAHDIYEKYADDYEILDAETALSWLRSGQLRA